ncbi:MAG: PAS domain S-box protein [Methanoregula sp.]|jgi:PAS domain S-box-containing protein|nr:PAS domain S-box protein [Methanoregula sp.]
MTEKIRVLCVDDEPVLLEIEKKFLEMSGELSVDVILSAEEALNNLNKKSYDVIVSDYLMPEIDGIEFLKRVRAVDKTIPFIIFTGRSREEVVIEALNNGANFYLHKGGEAGILYKELLSIIRQSVQMRRTLITLAEKEQRYHDLQNANDLIQSVAPDGHFFFVNKKWLDTLGYEEQDLPNLTLFDIIAEESLQHCMETFQRVMSGENVGIIDAVFTTRDGKKVYVDGIADCNMVDGQPQYTRGLFKDVTERKRAEHELLKKNEELQASEENLRKIFLNSAVGMTLASPDLRFLLVNPAWVSMIGYTEEEFKEMSFTDITHPDDLISDIEGIKALGSGSIPVYNTEKRYIKKDGSTLWASLNVTTIRNPDGSLRHYLAQIDDITLRKQAEELVRESENKFATVFASSPVALTLVSATDGTFVDVNDAFLKNTGYSRNEVIGKTSEALRIFADNDEYERLVNTIRTHRIVHDIEISCRIKSGVIRTCLFSSSLIMIRGKPHIYSTVQDITERKITESAFQTMVRSMVGTTGLNSLQKITENVSSWLGAECVMVGKIQADGETVKVLSMHLDGKEVTDFSYTLKGTPCENVAEKGFCRYPDNAIQLFPESKDLVLLNIRGYIGTPLRNSAGEVMGILCALFRSPIKPSPAVQEIMNIIAVKAAAEIERKRTEEALRESEKRFRTIIHSVQFGVVIIDAQTHTILDANKKALEIIGGSSDIVIGSVCHRFICPAESGKCPVTDLKQTVDSSERVLFTLDGKKIHILKSVIPSILGGKDILIESFIDITERIQAEEALKKSEEKFRNVFDWANDAILLHTLTTDEASGIFIDANLIASRMLGYSQEELLSMGPPDIVPTELHSQLGDVIRESQTKDEFIFETRLRRKDGTTFPVESSAHIVNYKGKKIWISHIRDITERKRVEKALADESIKYKILIEQSRDGIVILDQNGKVYDANRRFANMLGYSSEEIKDLFVWDWDTQIERVQLLEMIRTIDEAGDNFETQHLRKDGTKLSVEISTNATVFSGKKLIFCVVRDITERKQAEEALKQSEEQYRLLAEQVHDGIYIYQGNRFIFVNSLIARITGYSKDELLAMDFIDIVHPDDRVLVQDIAKRRLRGEQVPDVYEIRVVQKDGAVLYVELAVSIISFRGRYAVLGAARDTTERKALHDAVKLANKQLNLLSSITRHDILNQLMVLKGYLELSHEEINNPATLTDFINKEKRASNTIERQIMFTRDYQELGASVPTWQNVNASIRKAVAGLPMRDIRVEPEPADPEVYADPLFEKVFYNLIDNALRYGGEQMKTIRVLSQESDASLTIICEDDGVGITAEDKKKLFTKGFGKNTGLGLFLSREILAITRITITENGTSGKGARFEITVPKGMYRLKGGEHKN